MNALSYPVFGFTGLFRIHRAVDTEYTKGVDVYGDVERCKRESCCDINYVGRPHLRDVAVVRPSLPSLNKQMDTAVEIGRNPASKYQI